MKPAEDFTMPPPLADEMRWNPHARAPILLTGTGVVRVDKPWSSLSVRDLLAEPPRLRIGEWLAGIYARLLAVSSGCVATTLGQTSADDAPLYDRLEKANIFRAAPSADLIGMRDRLWPTLPALREAHWGIGSPKPKLVLCGELAPKEQLPFFSKAGPWLLWALRALGYDEMTIYLTNAYTARAKARLSKLTHLQDLFGAYSPTWVALGNAAHQALDQALIQHVWARHPQYVSMFDAKKRSEGYAEELRENGVPPGPWLDMTLPVVPTPEVLPSMPPSLDMPKTRARNITSAHGERRRSVGYDLRPDIYERCKTAYITGFDPVTEKPTRTLAQVGEVTGANPRSISTCAARDSWRDLRNQHIAQKTADAQREASKAEAGRVAKGVASSSAGTVELLNLVNFLVQRERKKLEADPHAEVELPFLTPAGAKNLAETWAMLSARNDTQGAEAAAKFKSLSPLDQAAEAAGALAAQFGLDTVVDAIKAKMASKPEKPTDEPAPEASIPQSDPSIPQSPANQPPPEPPDDPPLELAPDLTPTPPV